MSVPSFSSNTVNIHDSNILLPKESFVDACDEGNIDLVKKIFNSNPGVINKKENGELPLVLASSKHLEVVKFLLKNGADPTLRDEYGVHALDVACEKGKFEIVKELINTKKFDLNQRDPVWGETLLHRSVEKTKIVELLLKKGAKVDIADIEGWTPLHKACSNRNLLPIVKMLLKKSHNGINFKTSEGWTPLHLSTRFHGSEAVELLIENGACIGTQDALKNTPLHAALQDDCRYEAAILKKSGANFYAKNDQGRTPWDLAINEGHCGYFSLRPKEKQWRIVSVYQRGEEGCFIPENKKNNTTFRYLEDFQTKDLYSIESRWSLLGKSICVLGASFAYSPLKILYDLAMIIGDLMHEIFIKISDASLKPSDRLKKIISNVPSSFISSITYRISDIVKAPLFSCLMVFAFLKMPFDPDGGRRRMNEIEENWGQKGFLKFFKMEKVGNLTTSQISGLAQFYLVKKEK